MRRLGVDVGSRSIKLVLLDGDELVLETLVATTFDPVGRLDVLLAPLTWDALVATGYGRRLVVERFGGRAVTEIAAHALGARHLVPGARGVVDVGGQDTKAVALDEGGEVTKFDMNDRCAAGTGKFLEVMATTFQIPLNEFGTFASRGAPGLTITNMCTVFAESEATTLMARGTRPEDVARALHEAVANRAAALAERVGAGPPVVFTGGVARNPCVVELLRRRLGEVVVPGKPELAGALGAALSARPDASPGPSRTAGGSPRPPTPR